MQTSKNIALCIHGVHVFITHMVLLMILILLSVLPCALYFTQLKISKHWDHLPLENIMTLSSLMERGDKQEIFLITTHFYARPGR